MSELKPCPFCGSDSLRVAWVNRDMCRVHCYGCGADGATCFNEQTCVEWWNTRAGPLDKSEQPGG